MCGSAGAFPVIVIDTLQRIGRLGSKGGWWQMLPTLVCVTVVALTLPGCIAVQRPGPDLTRELVATPEMYRALYYIREHDVKHGWLSTFEDPVLIALVDEAIERNYDLLQAAAVRQQSIAALRLARSTLLPRIDGLGAVEWDEGTTRAEELIQLEIGLAWEADLWGRLRAGRMASEQDAVATAFEYEYLRQSLAALVAETWFTAIAAQKQIAINLERVESELATASVAASRAEAGAGELIDNDFAQANLAFAEEELAASHASYEQVIRTLELLLSRYPNAALEAAVELPLLPELPATGVPFELLERRPDLIAAEARVAAAFHRVQASQLARLPRLRLFASGGVELDPAQGIWTLAADIFAPLFTAGEITAQIDIATAQQRASMAAYVNAALRALSEVEVSLANQMYLDRQSRALDVAVERLASANQRAQARFEAGIMTVFELNQVRQNYFRAQSQHLAVQLEMLRQRLNLHLAVGGSFNGGYGSIEELQPWIGHTTNHGAATLETTND